MLKTRNGIISLAELEQLLMQSLSPGNVGVLPRKVSCLLREKNLMVMLHYQQPAMPYPRKLFAVVKEKLAELSVTEQYQVLLYLIVQDQYQTNLLPSTPQVSSPSPPTLPETANPRGGSTLSLKALKLPRIPKFALGGIGVVTAIFLGYLAQRHCVFASSCELIPQANRLAKQAELIVNYTPGDLNKAQEQLHRAQQLLQSIPSLSPHYREAQHLTQNYQRQAKAIANLLEAEKLKKEASSLIQFPLDQETARKIESLWNEAIALLETIPLESSLSQLSQSKLKEFHREKQAISSFKAAQAAAQIAKVRETVARTLENWQLVAATWRTAVERLASIPKDSQIASTREIQQLTAIYQSRLAQTNQRVEQEKVANQLYQQAQEQAQLAQNYLDNRDWQNSLTHWRQGLAILEQITPESSLYTDAQTLGKNYQQSLERVQAQQAIAFNLEQVCSAQIRICDYQIDNQVIKVELTPVYQEQLSQVILSTDVQANAPVQMQLKQHLTGLEMIFQSISTSTGKPVEIYDAQQSLIVTYQP